MKQLKRICALLLCLIVMIGIFPISIFAETVTISEWSVSKYSSNYMYFYSASGELAYCINRGKAIAYNGTGYNKSTSFSDAYWDSLPDGVRKGIALALVYGHPTAGFGSDTDAARAATQALIWDIQKRFVFGSSGNIGAGNSISDMMPFETFSSILTDGLRYDTIYKHVQNDATNAEFIKFRDHYLKLWNRIKAHGTKPVFGGYTAASSADSAHIYEIPSSNTLTLTDSAKSLYFGYANAYQNTVYVDTTPTFDITYSNTDDTGKITVARNQNTLTITQSSPLIGTATIKINKGPSPSGSQAYLITHGSDQQLVGGRMGYDPIPTYIKVKSSTVSNKFTLQKEADCSTTVKNELSGNPMYSLAGAKYAVYTGSANGTYQETLTTDANGCATSSKSYPAGTIFYVKETVAPNGYKLNTNPAGPFTINANSSQNTFTVKDEPAKDPINLRIYKVDKQNNTIFLQGAVFKLQYYAQSTLPTSSSTPTRTWYLESDANGYISYNSAHLASNYTSSALYTNDTVPLGYIKITEEKAPVGYAAASNTTFYYHIYQSSNGSSATHEWLNASGNPLTTSSNIIYKTNGEINILNDKYDVKVVKSYSCSDAIYNEKIKDNPLYSLSGAVFDIRLYSATGTIQETVTTDANGEAVLTGKYAVGTVLYAVEKTAPAGYKTASAVRLTVTSNSANNVFRVNDPPVFNTFNTTLQKVDSTNTARMLSGAIFKYSYYTNYSGTGSPARVWYFQSDSDGDIKYDASYLASGYSSSSLFTNGIIPLGRIVVEEVVAPSGYSLDTTSKAVYDITQASAGMNATGKWTVGSGIFSYSNTTHYLTAKNQPLYLKIYKKIADGSSGSVTGWAFNVYQGNTLIGTYTTNTTETVGGVACGVITTNIAAGTYRIEEVAKDGWVAQPAQNVTVASSNTPDNPATVSFTNQQEPNFKIYKSIAANSTGSVTGWQFKVYQGNTLIDTYTINQTEVINGVTYGVITTLLPAGSYRVEEVAKDGWISQPAQTVTVTKANSLNNPATVSFENEKLSVRLEKQYTKSGLPDGYNKVTFLSSENQNLLGEHCYSSITIPVTQNIAANTASSDLYAGIDKLTDRSRATNTIEYVIETGEETLTRYIPESICYILVNNQLLIPGSQWYVSTTDRDHIKLATALSAGDTVQIVYLTRTVDGNATIHHITSGNTVDVHNLTTNKTYWFYEIPVPGYKASGENPQSIQLHGNDNGQLTFVNEPDVCGISIEKTTSDGSSVAGWMFNLYQDGDISRYDACTFNGTGNAAYDIFSISNNSCVDSVFAVYVNNSWYDNRNGDMFTYSETTGTLTFLKAIPQPSDTVQVVYTREDYNDPYNDDPYITDEHGLITDDDLPEGIYNVEEIPTLGYLYQPPVTGVRVAAGQITAVDFHNVPTDTNLRVEKGFKNGTYGNKQGWEFAVIDVDEFGDLGVDHVFAMDSFIYDSATYSEELSKMLPGHPNVCGIYSVYRNGALLGNGHDYQVQGGELDIGLASVENGDEITVVYSPVIDMNYLYHSPNYHIISTNQYGIANAKDLAGEWFVEEIPQYGHLQQPVQDVSIYSKTTEYLKFENTRLAKIQIKKTDTSGNPLEGVQFILQYKGVHEDTWRDAVYSVNWNGAVGTFYTDNHISGNKTISTDANGRANFNCIAASTAYEYRLIETTTTTDRNGRHLSLLAQPIEIGTLPKALEFNSSAELQEWLGQQDNLSDYVVNGNSVMQYTLHYTIANGSGVDIPFTGSTEMMQTVLTGFIMMAFALGMFFIVYRLRAPRLNRGHKAEQE